MAGASRRAAGAGRTTRVALVYDVLYPWVRGGAEKRYWEIARRLPAHGFEPHLIGPKYWDGPSAIQRDGAWLHGICPPRDLYSEQGTRTISEALAYARDLFPALLRLNVDLIDCCAFPYFPWFSARAAAMLRSTPIITMWPELWGPYWRSYLGPARGTIAQMIERVTARLSAQHLCLSPFTEQRLRAVLPHGAQITPIPAGIDRRTLARYATPLDSRDGIIFIGRLLAHKRVDDLLRAFATVREAYPAATLTIVGQGPEEAALRAVARRLGLEDAVAFLSNLSEDELYKRLGQARCLVLPSEREGQGIVVAEAQAVGTPPIVATGPETAAADFVQNGIDGLLYPAADTAALAGAIQALLSDDACLMRLRQGAVRAAANLDWDTAILPSITKLYRRACSTRTDHAPERAARCAETLVRMSHTAGITSGRVARP